MNPIEAATAEAIKEVLVTIRDSKAFVLSQAPDLAQQYLAYEIMCHTVSMWAGIGFLCVGVLGIILLIKGWRDSCEGMVAVEGVMMVLGVIFGLTMATVEYLALWKCLHAPKLVLLQGLAELVK